MKKSIRLLTLLFTWSITIQLSAQQKNVLLIAVDDLNDWVGAFGGNDQAITPNIDALAAKGVAFQNASAASPVCNPSRTALLTGRRPHETGITTNQDGFNFRDSPEAWISDLITLPQYFSANGYESVGQGKIFHTHGSNPESWDILGPGGQGANGGTNTTVGTTGMKYGWSQQNIEQTGDWKSADYAANYLLQNHDKPFFLACGIFRPHLPFYAPQSFYDLYDTNNLKIPEGYLANDLDDTFGGSNNFLAEVQRLGEWKNVIEAYLACMSFTDAAVGHLLTTLENSQYANNTIVVLYGDHGWHLGEKEHFKKSALWERAVTTPLIIYDPSGGSGDNFNAVSLQDIYPTLVRLAGLPDPSFTIRGRDLSPLVQDPRGSWCGAALTSYRTGDHSLRSDRYRYIKFGDGDEELYDHQTDPFEWNNLAGDSAFATVKQEMLTAMNAMLDHDETPFDQCSPVQTGQLIPGKIEAESYVAQSGMQTQSTTDTGGGQNVGFIDTGDFMDYAVNVASSGGYDVSFRVASNANDIRFDLENGSTILTSVNTPTTGGWQTWKTVTQAVTLSAGQQTLRIRATGGGWNINWIDYVSAAPSSLNINDLSGNATACNSVTLTWSDVNGDEGYRVRRKPDGASTFTTLTDIATNSISYVDNTVTENTSYTYQVRALVGGSAAGASNQPGVTTPACSSGGGVVFIDHNSSAQRLKANASGGAVGLKTATSIGANVQWDQVDAGGGFFYLVHQGSGNKLHSSDGLTVNTTAPSATDNNVQWSWVDAGGEWYRLEHKGSGTWLHARQDATDFRLGPTSWTGNNTRWKFANVSAPAARLASKEGEKPVEPMEPGNVIIYPNPVQNILEIDGITAHSGIKIYNSSGTELLNMVGKDKIDVSSFEQGIYFLKIDNEKTIRFIKI